MSEAPVFTDEELERLRIPLTDLPGLDPIGLRVLWAYGTGDERQAVISGPYGGRSFCLRLVDHTEAGMNRSSGRQWFRLDLVDGHTADRVARWIAVRTDLKANCTAPLWGWNPFASLWVLRTSQHSRSFTEDHREADYIVPGLVFPTDDRRLPDGSFYIDRLTLMLAAVHLGRASLEGS